MRRKSNIKRDADSSKSSQYIYATHTTFLSLTTAKELFFIASVLWLVLLPCWFKRPSKMMSFLFIYGDLAVFALVECHKKNGNKTTATVLLLNNYTNISDGRTTQRTEPKRLKFNLINFINDKDLPEKLSEDSHVWHKWWKMFVHKKRNIN